MVKRSAQVSPQDADGAGHGTSTPLTDPSEPSEPPLEPMSAETYKDIMTDLGRINQSLYMVGEDQFSEEELALRQDMAMNKAVWCGDFRRDLWYFMININPFLSACYSHPLHPISRIERYAVYLMSFVLVTNISAAIAIAGLCRPCQYESCGLPLQLNCSGSSVDVSLVPHVQSFEKDFLPDFCCNSENLGSLYFLDHYGVFGGTLYAVLANVAFSLTCFQLIMCPCVQKLSKRRRRIGEIVGSVLVVVIAGFTLAYSSPFFTKMYLSKRLLHTVYFFVSTKTASWCGASIFNVVIFNFLFFVQRPKPQGSCLRCLDPPSVFGEPDKRCCLIKAVNPRFHVLALEYQDWVRKVRSDSEGVPRIVSMQTSPGHESGGVGS